jgi:peptidoglycan glycosyltransferase
MVTSPSYDTNARRPQREAVNATYDDLVASATNPLWNRAIGEPQPARIDVQARRGIRRPGIGQFTPDSTFQNPSTYTLPGRRDDPQLRRGTCGPGDTVTIATALRLSCNIPMAQLASRSATTRSAPRPKYGFNTEFDIPLDVGCLGLPAGPSDAQTALTGFGQGTSGDAAADGDGRRRHREQGDRHEPAHGRSGRRARSDRAADVRGHQFGRALSDDGCRDDDLADDRQCP